MRRAVAGVVATLVVAVGLVLALPLGGSLLSPTPVQPPLAEPADWPTITATLSTTSHTLVDGETASEALDALRAPTRALVAGAAGALDHVGVGDVIDVDWRAGEATPWRVRVDQGDASVLALSRTPHGYTASRLPIPYNVVTGPRTVTVTTSLWEGALDAGLRPTQILAVADLFASDVDFNTELLPGAVISLAVDTLTDDAGVSHVGDIRAARLQNGAKSYTQIRFRAADGTIGWYHPDGTGAKKPFLRSPLPFLRVTSGFAPEGRFHPVLGYNRPHLGVDLGAPTGTPVRAVADGVVTFAGWAGGYGNHIALQHAGPNATGYSHLSVIRVKKGEKVHQGDLIGNVGMTGLATGPHLHYEFFINGKYVNPMTVALPAGGEVELGEADKAAFDAAVAVVLPMIGG